MPMRVVASVPDLGRLRVEARTESGQPIDMDGDPPEGDDSAAGPREALLAALAGCTAMDVVSILRKKRQRAIAYEVQIEAESADAQPRVFTAITIEHRVSGAVEAEALRRSVELSATRYCPVSAMLSRAVPIQHRYWLQGGQSVLVAVTGPDGVRIA